MIYRIIFIFFLFLFPNTLKAQQTADFEDLVVLYESKKEPGPFDWLAQHEENGQTFAEYQALRPVMPDRKHPFIYIALLGDFTEPQKQIIDKTARYIEVYFQTPVKFAEPIPLSIVPQKARRMQPFQKVSEGQTQDLQILTTTVIEDILKPRFPSDAFAFIAFTSSDLWPGEGWNFVFGQASMQDRIGVWSIHRNGDAVKEQQLCLRRTIQTGTHEVGHLFGLEHCIYYECNMNGSNSRQENDRRPLWDCPVCLRKLSSSLKFDLAKRYRELTAISKEFGLQKEAEFFLKNLVIIEHHE